MDEGQINEAGVYVEPYAGGFMLADYRDGDNARYYGSDLSPRRQPITNSPFTDRDSAVAAGTKLLDA